MHDFKVSRTPAVKVLVLILCWCYEK